MPDLNIQGVISKYTLSVEDFYAQLSRNSRTTTISTLETLLLQILTTRDELQSIVESKHLSSDQLAQVFAADKTLFTSAKKAIQQYRLNPGKWRYLMSEPASLGWWWKLDKNPVRRDDQIVYEAQISLPLLLGVLLFAIAFVIVLLTTQQLWSKGSDLLGYLNLGIQALVGAGLITESGQQTALRLLSDFARQPSRFFAIFTGTKLGQFPLEMDRRGGNVGILAASVVFLVLILVSTGFLMPWVARQMHELGVEAIKRQDAAGAQLFLDLAVQLQPDFLRLFQTDVTVDLAQLGNLYFDAGNIEKARETYERALANDSANVTVHYPLAEIYIKAGEYEHAITLLDQAVNLLRDDLQGSITLALSGEQQVIELLYLSLLTRANAYYAGYSPESALEDLNAAKALVSQYPDIFISTENLQQPSGRRVTELHVMLARVRTSQFYKSACQENFGKVALKEWETVQQLGFNTRISSQRLWEIEARETKVNIENLKGCEGS